LEHTPSTELHIVALGGPAAAQAALAFASGYAQGYAEMDAAIRIPTAMGTLGTPLKTGVELAELRAATPPFDAHGRALPSNADSSEDREWADDPNGGQGEPFAIECYHADDFRGVGKATLRKMLAIANNEALQAEQAVCECLDAIYPLAVYLCNQHREDVEENESLTAPELAVRILDRYAGVAQQLSLANSHLADQVDEEERLRGIVETRIDTLAGKVDLACAVNRELREENATLRQQVEVLKRQVVALHEVADPESRTLFCLPNPAEAGPLGWKSAAQRWEAAFERAHATLEGQDRTIAQQKATLEEVNEHRAAQAAEISAQATALAEQGRELSRLYSVIEADDRLIASAVRTNDELAALHRGLEERIGRQKEMLHEERALKGVWEDRALKLFGQAGGYRTQMLFLASGIQHAAAVVERLLERRQQAPNAKPHYRDLIGELRDVFAPVQAAASTYQMCDRPVDNGPYVPHDPAQIAELAAFRYQRKGEGATVPFIDAVDMKHAHEATTEATEPRTTHRGAPVGPVRFG
jgi:hypothetical protein